MANPHAPRQEKGAEEDNLKEPLLAPPDRPVMRGEVKELVPGEEPFLVPLLDCGGTDEGDWGMCVERRGREGRGDTQTSPMEMALAREAEEASGAGPLARRGFLHSCRYRVEPASSCR